MFLAEASLLHHWYGGAAGQNDISNGSAGNCSHKTAAYYRREGSPSSEYVPNIFSDFQKQRQNAGVTKQRPKDDKQKNHISRDLHDMAEHARSEAATHIGEHLLIREFGMAHRSRYQMTPEKIGNAEQCQRTYDPTPMNPA